MGLTVSKRTRHSLSASSVSGGIQKVVVHRSRSPTETLSAGENNIMKIKLNASPKVTAIVHSFHSTDPKLLIQKTVQVYWSCSDAWYSYSLVQALFKLVSKYPDLTFCNLFGRFDCDVLEYSEFGKQAGRYLVEYTDGIREWRTLHDCRHVNL